MKARFFLLPVLALAVACQGNQKDEFAALYEGLPFDMPRVELPSIPNRSVVLTDFGGIGDGVTLNTDAFAAAIDALVKQGGGRLIVPAGVWRTGPIELKSHIELYVDKDAIVVFDPNQDLYPIIDTNFEGLDVRRTCAVACLPSTPPARMTSPSPAAASSTAAENSGARSSTARCPRTSGRPS